MTKSQSKFQGHLKHFKASCYGGTIGNVHAKAHTKYEPNQKQESIWGGQFRFRKSCFSSKDDLKRGNKSPAGGEQIAQMRHIGIKHG